MNKIIEAAKVIREQQSVPPDFNKESDEEYGQRLNDEDEWIGGISYRGNSISWSYSKAENYKRALLEAWGELNKLGIVADGNTSVAQAIAKFCAIRGHQQSPNTEK